MKKFTFILMSLLLLACEQPVDTDTVGVVKRMMKNPKKFLMGL